MGDKRSPTRPKRQPKPSSADEGYWDCSVCTYTNTAEAFKCMMCDVRKGTSTRKPRPVSQLVSQQQVTQQFSSPTQPKKEKKERVEREKGEREREPTPLKKNAHKKMRPRLKNIDRSSAQHLEVTVGDLTVIITDFKEKARPAPTSASTTTTTTTSTSSSSSSLSLGGTGGGGGATTGGAVGAGPGSVGAGPGAAGDHHSHNGAGAENADRGGVSRCSPLRGGGGGGEGTSVNGESH